ncbi:hypothetical protein TREES_T100007808 [Tupaia chinensis]|uniref:Uncharacterized protein n=1 Tax=Tupaia chinensis TaxID=246437 RepID=L9KHG4_TUPCH|nr:hypothetical protein TREES_T100007808 [Tupaia chinensis]
MVTVVLLPSAHMSLFDRDWQRERKVTQSGFCAFHVKTVIKLLVPEDSTPERDTGTCCLFAINGAYNVRLVDSFGETGKSEGSPQMVSAAGLAQGTAATRELLLPKLLSTRETKCGQEPAESQK